MIFDALSNAAHRVSLRGPGAEIEGGGFSTTPPPVGGGKSRGPAGRGLKLERRKLEDMWRYVLTPPPF